MHFATGRRGHGKAAIHAYMRLASGFDPSNTMLAALACRPCPSRVPAFVVGSGGLGAAAGHTRALTGRRQRRSRFGRGRWMSASRCPGAGLRTGTCRTREPRAYREYRWRQRLVGQPAQDRDAVALVLPHGRRLLRGVHRGRDDRHSLCREAFVRGQQLVQPRLVPGAPTPPGRERAGPGASCTRSSTVTVSPSTAVRCIAGSRVPVLTGGLEDRQGGVRGARSRTMQCRGRGSRSRSAQSLPASIRPSQGPHHDDDCVDCPGPASEAERQEQRHKVARAPLH